MVKAKNFKINPEPVIDWEKLEFEDFSKPSKGQLECFIATRKSNNLAHLKEHFKNNDFKSWPKKGKTENVSNLETCLIKITHECQKEKTLMTEHLPKEFIQSSRESLSPIAKVVKISNIEEGKMLIRNKLMSEKWLKEAWKILDPLGLADPSLQTKDFNDAGLKLVSCARNLLVVRL